MKGWKFFVVLLMAAICMSLLVGTSIAEEKISIKGKIKSYDLEAKTVVVVADDGKEMTFEIQSDRALKKLDDRLFVDDEVKIRYSEKDGKKVIRDSNDLKGTKPGC